MSINTIKENVIKLSNEYTKNTDKSTLKKYGQFFTLNEHLLEQLFNDIELDNKIILEPSCGYGMIIYECLKRNKDIKIDAIEIDKNIYNKTKLIYKECNRIQINNNDFLTYNFENKYDLIIGNPPYFEINNKDINKELYSEIVYGRTNIYSLFIYKSIKLLKENGILSFIIPSTILSGKYFSKIREFIVKECNIIDIIKFDDTKLFTKALQSVIVLKLQKKYLNENLDDLQKKFLNENSTDKFTIYINDNIFFVKNKELLKFDNTTTIKLLNCKVKTGNIVWNQKKEYLTENDKEKVNKTFPLLYASNIKNGILNINCSLNENKKQYLIANKNTEKYIEKGPFLLINRIIGTKIKKLNVYFEKNCNCNYFIENHINIISGNIENLTKIYNSLNNEKTINFINEFICNTQLSQEELENIIPIYL